jgi:hypothetical protein
MNNLAPIARSAVDELTSLNDEQLYEALGSRLSAISRTPQGSDQFNMVLAQPLVAYGPLDELKKLGRKFFARWNAACYNLVCGSSADDADARKQVANAFDLGPAAVAAAIAAALTAYLGIAAALAPIIATLAIRLFFKPGHQAMCDYWKEKMSA